MAPRPARAMQAAVQATGLLAGDGPHLLLCSAGRDSACLLDLAASLRCGESGARPAGAAPVPEISVLHVDHGLRPQSGAEAQAVQAAGVAHGLDVVVRRVGPAPQTGNLHAWAREERARIAGEEARRLGARLVATAHTRTDLVETALFRLATQPGRRALLAMRAREPDAFGPGIDLVRPLLELGRDETLSWCVERGLSWREDPSNAAPRFARARLRHVVTPVLRALNPRFEEAVGRTLAELAEERAVLDALVDEALAPHDGTVSIERLAALPPALGRLTLRELCERSTGRTCPRAGARLGELTARALASPSPFSLDLGDGARACVRGGVLRCEPSTGPAAPGRGGA